MDNDTDGMFWYCQLGQDIDGKAANDNFGNSVSLSADGSTLAVGALTYTRVYVHDNNSWTLMWEDPPTSYQIKDNRVSLSANGNVMAIGKHLINDFGGFNCTVQIYTRLFNQWFQMGRHITVTEYTDASSGISVSLSADGNMLAVGVPFDKKNGFYSGHVQIYKLGSNDWSLMGQVIDGSVPYDYFGGAVSLSADGKTVAVGAPWHRLGNAQFVGTTRVYTLDNNSWTQIGQSIDGDVSNSYFGVSVSVSADGSMLAVGAPGVNAVGAYSGRVRAYKFVNNVWVQIGRNIDGASADDKLGTSVSLTADGQMIAVGAPLVDYNNGQNYGNVRVYRLVDNEWNKLGQTIYGETAGDWAGLSIFLSANGNMIAAGAPFNSDNGSYSGNVRVFRINAEELRPTMSPTMSPIYRLGVLRNDNIQKAVTDWCNVTTRPDIENIFGNIRYWDTSQVTDMSYLFVMSRDCNPGNLSAWNTSSVTSMLSTFSGLALFNSDLSWDVSQVVTMRGMFNGCTSFNGYIGRWNTSNVIDMSSMFNDAHTFNQPIGDWNTTLVTNMGFMFANTVAFNQPIGSWDMSSVTNTAYMFANTIAFNQPLSTWNTSGILSMIGMFSGTQSFNQPINTWRVSSVIDMSGMFQSSRLFNQPLDMWDTKSVENMNQMFYNAKSFDGNIGTWKTNRVRNMDAMFSYTPFFNQPIEKWDVSGVSSMREMFAFSEMFDQPIGKWNISNVLNMRGMFFRSLRFNQYIDDWDIMRVNDMGYIFEQTNTIYKWPICWDLDGLSTNIPENMYVKTLPMFQACDVHLKFFVNKMEHFHPQQTTSHEPPAFQCALIKRVRQCMKATPTCSWNTITRSCTNL